ncbi:hypothetical protein K7X08_019839 [Anisodus acutangulus]|uniref:Glycoside hydrolase family 38 N-terminal domain-containing protein n=1 Tax=Anisodus acutangulus TaxID=402998 RepID=A0A9Q1RR02_9SOLA|nr:hypothetical protein K7X08_019839 [Anisodus acutangulus]
MGTSITIASFLLFILHMVCSIGGIGVDGYLKYNTGGGIVEGKLNVPLVPHSHDDVGWLKTIDQYYGACVENVLDSVVMSLRRDPNRKFVFAEMAFFNRWWIRQSPEIQEEVRNLVASGQLEFVNGGWCMHDEATCHYIDMIDQITLGHQLIKNEFNITPRAGWQIDPFGHSAVQAYLLGAEVGFDSVHFARIDYQDRAKRKEDKALEVIWRALRTFGSSSQIFTNAFPVHYSPPTGFHFEVDDEFFVPVLDDPLIFDFNVDIRVNDFINAAITQLQDQRLLYDDCRGVGESLDETVCVERLKCEGLTVRGNYYLGIHKNGDGSRWRRTTGQEIYSPLVLAFGHENQEEWKAPHITKATITNPNYSLPPNVALITLQELDNGGVLLCLAHLYEAGEDADYSTIAKVQLKEMFAGKRIKAIKETSLSAN